MITDTLRRFARARRSAVAITLAVSILPLMLLVGIAIDFTLLSQARSQSAFAAQAAATQAVRVAASTYALEVQNGSSPAVAVAHAIAAANSAGDLWWGAELGPLSQGYVSYEQTKTTSTNSNSSPPNFTAAVAYNVTYPPIFDPLFGQPNTKWIYASSATATAQFAYAQILMMLDTSNSMLIGARQSDIQTMETSAVCPPNNTLAANEFASTVKLSYNSGSDNDYNFAPGDNTWIGFTPSDSPHALHYNKNSTATGTEPADSLTPGGKSPYQLTGPCDSGYQSVGGPFEPCALACHSEANATFTATTTVNGVTATRTLPADLYGLARSEGVELRVDVLLSATETAISDMLSTEAVANQISVGVYQFNSDIAPIVRGNTANGDSLPEATSNLSAALTAVQNDDYNYTPSETAIPALVPGCSQTYVFLTAENCSGNTNLVLSLQHLISGKLPTDANAQPLTQAGAGTTGTAPIKFMFLITDGMEDETTAGGATDLATNPNFANKGVMTNTTDNTAVTSNSVTAGTCTAIKKLGYIVYVLYVDYLPVSQTQYYASAGHLSPQTTADYSTAKYLVDIADSEPEIQAGVTQNETASQVTAAIAANVPTAKALSACASSPAYFYSANSDTDIQTALNAMLKSALASTTRLTN
jgi:Flp pilus assembly protein TadG